MIHAPSEIQSAGMPTEKLLSVTPHVHPDATIIESRLGAYTEVGPRTHIEETVMDNYSYITNDGHVIYCRVGKFCSIAAMVRINPGNHPMHRPGQHHFTYRSRQFGMGDDDAGIFEWRRNKPVSIGHDVWVGHGVTIMGGVCIGHGAVVGAGAVVTKDVSPYTVVAGVPAIKIRDRFDKKNKKALSRIQWWHWSHQQLTEAMEDFRNLDIGAFTAKYDVT